MASALTILSWLRKHWWVGLLSAVGFILWVLRMSKESPADTWKIEKEAAEAASHAREVEITLGAELARTKIKTLHAEQIKKLNKEQEEHAEKLANDPAALARFLVRAGSRS